MNEYISTFSSISVLVLLISFIAVLRHFGVLKKEDGMLFSTIVTHITLPALIFYVLSHSKSLQWEYIIVILFVLLTEIIVLGLAYFIGKKLHIQNAQLGTLMITSAFGSSALLGYAVISQVFPSNIKALSEAVLISELGVGVGLFTIGTMVAIYFGDSLQKQTPLQSIMIFLKSPIFIAIIAGLTYNLLSISTDAPVIKELFKTINIISRSNTFFVALTVGVLLEVNKIRPILTLVIIAVIFKLFFSPAIVYLASLSINLSEIQLKVVIIESAMPSAMLSVVLAKKYGCDAGLASKLVFATTIFSIFSLTFIMLML